MDPTLQEAILKEWLKLPSAVRELPASETALLEFEARHGPIPPTYRWFLSRCGGGSVGADYVDGIDDLAESHRKFQAESGPGGWTMKNVFIIGWDGAGNPFGIDSATGRVLLEDHNFGGIHEMAASFEALLIKRLLESNDES